MKTKILIPSVVCGALIGFFSFRYINIYAQPRETNAIIQRTVIERMNKEHYSPQEMNDAFSKRVFKKVIESLDFEKKFFTQADYDLLKKYETKIDDQVKDNNTNFFNELNSIFVKRVTEAEAMYKTILATPFTFNGNDSIQLDGEKLKFTKTPAEYKARWAESMKYRVLAKYVDLKKTQDKNIKDSANFVAKSDIELEKEARASVLKTQDRFFKRLKKLNENDRFAIYMNAITSAEDPHSDYFPPEDRKRFEEMMSGNFIGIGASLQVTDDGFTKVQMIITGSPSWRQGQLKAGDLIEKVQNGEQAPTEIEGYELEDVVKLIRGQAGSVVKLHVKKEDGTRQVIPIVRGKVELEDTYAKSSIVENEGKRIGYIYLPEFYTNFNGAGGRTSGEDVRNEVKKLMAEGVDGIVLDLRNNGGGSLGDVVEMAGIFIGSGPVVQVRARGNRVMPLLTSDIEPLYTGPLAIMVNGRSASASEILAAAMQDYGRAIIIGGTTFGKGTVQKIKGLDADVTPEERKSIIESWIAAKNGDAKFEGIGSVKLTIQKFYRIDGGSTQLKGVTPDILLPDAYEFLDEFGERKNPDALPWDKIDAVSFNKTNAIPNMAKMESESKKRVAANETFQLAKQTSIRIKSQQENNFYPLNESKFKLKLAEGEALSKKLEQIDSAKTKLSIFNPKVDLNQVNIDSSAKEKNQKWLDALKKDAYLNETVNVLNEWIKLVAIRDKN